MKTSAALVNPTGGHCRRGTVAPLVFPLPDEGEMVVAAEAAPKPVVVRKQRVAC